jgi:hypothetical protein
MSPTPIHVGSHCTKERERLDRQAWPGDCDEMPGMGTADTLPYRPTLAFPCIAFTVSLSFFLQSVVLRSVYTSLLSCALPIRSFTRL